MVEYKINTIEDVPVTRKGTLFSIDDCIYGISLHGTEIVDVLAKTKKFADKGALKGFVKTDNFGFIISETHHLIDPKTGETVHYAVKSDGAFEKDGVLFLYNVSGGSYNPTFVARKYSPDGSQEAAAIFPIGSEDPNILISNGQCFVQPYKERPNEWVSINEDMLVKVRADTQVSHGISNSTCVASEVEGKYHIFDLAEEGKKIAELPFLPEWRATFADETGWFFGYQKLSTKARCAIDEKQKTESAIATASKANLQEAHTFPLTYLVAAKASQDEIVAMPTGKRVSQLTRTKKVSQQEEYFINHGEYLIHASKKEVSSILPHQQIEELAIAGLGTADNRTLVLGEDGNICYALLERILPTGKRLDYWRDDGMFLEAKKKQYIPINQTATKFAEISIQ